MPRLSQRFTVVAALTADRPVEDLIRRISQLG